MAFENGNKITCCRIQQTGLSARRYTACQCEAIQRMCGGFYKDRMFGIKRALNLSTRHQILSKEQWTKYEEDKYYLEP
ncbi:hypothetical protein U0070_010447 [Myodes glareolus]|uniref:Cytochrome b-c1 complex subunit 7 n=1 Tax=Myodes glareolus TaxID=447135 RepID=A0AAW0I506_MYOGA